MLNALWWLLAIEVIALAVFPLAYHLLPSLRDRGYSISKPLGLLLIGYVSWILSQVHLVPSTRLSLAVMVLALACVSGWLAWRRRADILLFLKKEWRVVALAEIIFLVFFVAWTLYRASDPSIDHTEQPMDFAFLNASILTVTGPPQDPWLSGESVSYYYFGYWMMGALTELTGIASNVSYNLSMALVPAMAAQAVFGLTYSVVRSQTARLGTAVAGGFAAVLLLGVAANLEGMFEFMRANAIGSQGFWDWLGIKGLDGPLEEPAAGWYPQEFWWWFRATRVINTFEGTQELDYTIQEFPSFSLILGDLHPHVMAIPFALLAAAFCWDLFRRDHLGLSHRLSSCTGPNGSLTSLSAGWWRGAGSYAYMLALGLAIGGLAFTNMWDLPTYASLLLGVAVLKAYSLRTRGDAGAPTPTRVWTAPLLIAAGGIALAVLLFLPYHLTLQSSVSGIAPVPVTTRPVHMGIVWGLYLAVIAPFIIGAFWRTTLSEDWGRTAGLALGIAALPIVVWAFLHMESGGTTSDIWDRLVAVLPLASLIAIAVFTTFSSVRAEGATGGSFALALSALGLMLIMGPELLYIDEAFGTRMNTVFKLYYQAWVLLAVAAGFAFHFWANLGDRGEGWKRALGTIWAVVVCMLLLASLYYPPAAAASKAESSSTGGGTLDGLAYVAELRPAERDAIEFLRREAGRESTMVEAVGEWFDYGLISRSTGIPTVFNWPGHEVQWRGSADQFEGREQDVADIYQSERWDHVQNLLARYNVEYVYVGPRERSKYGTEGLEKFGEFMDTVFSKDDVTIYRVR